MLDRDWLDGLIDGLGLMRDPSNAANVHGHIGALLLRDAILAAPEPPSALAPRECGYGKLGVEDRAHKIWAANFNFCPDCGAALDDKGER